MCVSPGTLVDGTQFACRKCWQCLERKVDDWVGRCLAESKTAVASHSITLTYGRDNEGNEDHMRSAWLTYSDVQKFFKRLRIDGYRFRYLVAGEYGSMKGRAHWHLLIFWKNQVPPHELSTVAARRFVNKYWPHGYQHWEAPSAASIRYVCKYIQKDIGKDERQGHFAMSKKPPLGDAWFRWYADEHVRNGLAPQNLEYHFPDVRDRNGEPKRFFMSGTTARNFIENFKASWALHRGGHYPPSTVIEDHDDRLARGTYEPRREAWRPSVQPVFAGSGPFVGRDPLTGKEALYSDDNRCRWWYRDIEGEWTWQKERKGNPDVARPSQKRGAVATLPPSNGYESAKRGQDHLSVPPPRWR